MCSHEFKCDVMQQGMLVRAYSNCSWITDNGCESRSDFMSGRKTFVSVVPRLKNLNLGLGHLYNILIRSYKDEQDYQLDKWLHWSIVTAFQH
jgi:hypothetical protein